MRSILNLRGSACAHILCLVVCASAFGAANDGYILCRAASPGCAVAGSATSINSGAEVSEWCTCKTITNTSTKNVFVPTRTEAQYRSFLNHLPTNVTLGACTTNSGNGDYQILADSTVFNARGCDRLAGVLRGGGGGGGGTQSGTAGIGRAGGRVTITGTITIPSTSTLDVVVGRGGQSGNCTPQPVSGGSGGYNGGLGDDNVNGVAGTAGGGATGAGGAAGNSGASSNAAGDGNYGGGGGGGDNNTSTLRHGGGGGGASVVRYNGGADIVIAGGGGGGGGSNSNNAGAGGRACNGSANGTAGSAAGGGSAGGGGGGGACYIASGAATYANTGGAGGSADGACGGAGEGSDGAVSITLTRSTTLP